MTKYALLIILVLAAVAVVQGQLGMNLEVITCVHKWVALAAISVLGGMIVARVLPRIFGPGITP
ncbi:MAG: hypothetical protein Q8P73_03090 [bacterium]|nr:hypothetical protein [bacterium]